MKRTMHLSLSACLIVVALAAAAEVGEAAEPAADQENGGQWRQLFNGKNLEGWTPKIRYQELGVNHANTFRVEDGLLKVGYDEYDTFGEQFGHLFYKEEFSHYILRVEYRFVGEQVAGGPGWAIRNSGMMVHGERPETMSKDQDFPASIEVQLLGGGGSGTRPTANLCTPGTNVVIDGKLVTRHCTNSQSKTYHGDQWVVAEVEVHGGGDVIHRVNGEEVLRYSQSQLDPSDAHSRELIEKAGGEKLITKGTISLQSESHPVEFRKVELKVLAE